MTKTKTYQSLLLRKTLLLKLCMLLCLGASARGAVDTFGITVFGNASLYALDKAQVGILSSITNHGIFGAAQGTVIHMSGERWTNMAGASLPDELGVGSTSGIGGVFRFASRSTPQYVVPGFSLTSRTGISFPNLTISNPFGVTIEKTDAHVRNTLHLEDGLLWLNGNNLLVGVNDPGIITGYSKNNFVATGNSVKGGFLYRAKVSAASGSVLFPIGPQANSYAPLSIMYNTTKAQDLHVRVFDEVYSNAIIGTKGNLSYVQQTWNIGQENTDTVPSIIALQHNDTREGAAFTAHRGNSYISKFDFDVLRAWDTLPPSGIVNPAPYTTGPPLNNAYVNTRIMNSSLGVSTYLTKAADSRTDSLTLGKGALSPVRQPDGSFLVTFMFFVRNEGMYRADSLQVLDSLALVFKNTMSFGVQSVVATGNLKANAGFDGVSNTDLLLRNSSLVPNRTDTITLVLNVRIGVKEQYYYNTAHVRGVLNGFNNSQYVFNNLSVNGFTPPTPGTLPVPTPVILSESKFNMPHGFSPNGDGVNDRFVIGNLGNNKCAVWIFDKNGVYVYKNMDYHNDWDGTINQNTGGGVSGQKIADGTYFYKVVITDILSGTQETFNGFISVWK